MATRIVLGISGASGAVYGIRTLECLAQAGVETHLIVTRTSRRIIEWEAEEGAERILDLATHRYGEEELDAPVSSGSFRTHGMVVMPCSIKTLSGIAHSYGENLLQRAADVTLKERRPLVLGVRETPFHKGHLELMMRVADMGGIILPPIPAFYHRPRSIADLVDHVVGKILDLFQIEHRLFPPWSGPPVRPDPALP